MKLDLKKIALECSDCRSGSCCRDGVELSREEVCRIEAFNPKVKKPWFGKVAKIDDPEPGFEFETVLRKRGCVFQADNKLCLVYSVRPSYCRQFPLESEELAEFYELLCDKSNKFLNRCAATKRSGSHLKRGKS